MSRLLFAKVKCAACGKPFPASRYRAPRMSLEVHRNQVHRTIRGSLDPFSRLGLNDHLPSQNQIDLVVRGGEVPVSFFREQKE